MNNLIISMSVDKDNILTKEGHTFLGVGEVGGEEVHVFLHKDHSLAYDIMSRRYYVTYSYNNSATGSIIVNSPRIESEEHLEKIRDFIQKRNPGYSSIVILDWKPIKPNWIDG